MSRVGLYGPPVIYRPLTPVPGVYRNESTFLEAAINTTEAWRILVDLDGDGSYDHDWTERFTAINGSLTLRRGMGLDGQYQISGISGSFLNNDNELTPAYSPSSLYGYITPGIGIRIQIALAGTTYILWSGYITDWEFSWDAQRPNMGIATFSSIDIAGLLRERPVNVAVATSVLTGAAIGNILDEADLTDPIDRNLDAGQQTLDNHYVVEQDAWSAIVEVAEAEMGGFAWVTKGGAVHFEDRAQRLGITVDDTWGDGTSIIPSEESLRYEYRQLTAEVAAQGAPQQTGTAGTPVVVGSKREDTGDSASIGPGAQVEFDIPYAQPVTTIITPAATTDYKGNTAADGSGTDRTSSLGVTVTNKGGMAHVVIRNNHASDTVYLTKPVQIRGTPVSEIPDRRIYRHTATLPRQKLGGARQQVRVPFVGDA